MALSADILFTNVNLATMDPKSSIAYGTIEDAVIVVENGLIVWCGARADAPEFKAREICDCANGWITPGLVDCHTHLVFAGDRAGEVEMRLNGAS